MSMKLFAIFHSRVAFQHIYLHSICKLTLVQGVGWDAMNQLGSS